MSASLFYSDMSNIPENYLVYIDGEKKFGELQKMMLYTSECINTIP